MPNIQNVLRKEHPRYVQLYIRGEINLIISAFILNCVKIRVPVVYSVCVYVHLLLEWWWWW